MLACYGFFTASKCRIANIGALQSWRLTSTATARPSLHVLALSDSQLRAVWAAADGLPVEKRGVFLGRLVAQLQLLGSRFTTADLEDVVCSALKGLIQQSAA